MPFLSVEQFSLNWETVGSSDPQGTISPNAEFLENIEKYKDLTTLREKGKNEIKSIFNFFSQLNNKISLFEQIFDILQ